MMRITMGSQPYPAQATAKGLSQAGKKEKFVFGKLANSAKAWYIP